MVRQFVSCSAKEMAWVAGRTRAVVMDARAGAVVANRVEGAAVMVKAASAVAQYRVVVVE
jgi:hypothetical protein